MREAIEKRIEEFLARDDARFDWLKDAVRENGFLPLYRGWLSVLGIQPDGSYVRWDHEVDPQVFRPVLEGFLQRLAICEGVKEYPELAVLIPERPVTAQTCEQCGGSGTLAALPDVICVCGGTGWFIPGEPRDTSTG